VFKNNNKKMEKGTIEIIENKDKDALVVLKPVLGNVWMTQKQIARLFDRSRVIITDHIKNIFKEGELEKEKVTTKFQITAQDGNAYASTFYNLDMIIAVGFRVKSSQGVLFRSWAKNQLHKSLKNQAASNDAVDAAVE
jgi:hypothetical protein